MNQVDVYINNERLDLFQDEQISINVSVQNIKDLATIFTDFTQSFLSLIHISEPTRPY